MTSILSIKSTLAVLFIDTQLLSSCNSKHISNILVLSNFKHLTFRFKITFGSHSLYVVLPWVTLFSYKFPSECENVIQTMASMNYSNLVGKI